VEEEHLLHHPHQAQVLVLAVPIQFFQLLHQLVAVGEMDLLLWELV
tara:strand:+ start:286 stop:423 length:138 start_codon:yes stop_codon:yes gene_type:complete